MQDYNTLLMFAAASILLALAPGPDNIFVMTQSMLFGRLAGFIIITGLCTGLLFHTTLVSLGVAAVFQTSQFAFSILKYAGAIYLLYLAYGALRASASTPDISGAARPTARELYRRGIIMNITNPKVSIFFIAFLPQFTDPAKGSITVQMFLLGLIFIFCTIAVFGLICQLASVLGSLLKRSVNAQRVMNVISGMIFAALALRLALANR